MSVDFSAYAIVGIKIPIRKLKITEEVRGCAHAIADRAKYCDECGTPHWITHEYYLAGFDPGDSEWLGMDFARDYDADEIVIGPVQIRADGEGPVMARIVVTDQTVPDARRKLKELLEPLGLWDADAFGIWAVASVS